MLSGSSSKTNRYLTTNTSHNISPHGLKSNPYQKYEQSIIDDKHAVFQYPKKENENCQHYFKNNSSTPSQNKESGREQDDSLTSMEWLPEVSIPYMQQVRCKITGHPADHLTKGGTVSRKRNRNNSTTGGKECVGSHKKPEYSYAMLIYKAISDTEEKRMQLFQIYEWIENHFLYYKHTPGTHWKSSIRHNLSLHKIFVKEAPPASLKSKGSFWALDRRMTEEDWLLCLQPKRPRLARVPNSDPPTYAKRTFCPTPARHHVHHPSSYHHVTHHRPQHVYQHVQQGGIVPRTTTQHVQQQSGIVPRTTTQHVQQQGGVGPHNPHLSRGHMASRSHHQLTLRPHPYHRAAQQGGERVSSFTSRERRAWDEQGYRSRPNILSKVVRKDNRRDSITSPTGTSLMNLNQLFHTTSSPAPLNNSLSPGSNSYESGYSSLTDTCCSQNSPKLGAPRSLVCSTPLNKSHDSLGAWSSPPEFSFARPSSCGGAECGAGGGCGGTPSCASGGDSSGYHSVTFPMSYDDQELLPSLSHYIDSVSEGGHLAPPCPSGSEGGHLAPPCPSGSEREHLAPPCPSGSEGRHLAPSCPRDAKHQEEYENQNPVKDEPREVGESSWFGDYERHPVYYSTGSDNTSNKTQTENSVVPNQNHAGDPNFASQPHVGDSNFENQDYVGDSNTVNDKHVDHPSSPQYTILQPKKPPLQIEGDVIKIEPEEPVSSGSKDEPDIETEDYFNESPTEGKCSDIADLINQFISEGEVCSTTPLRQYLTEEESSLTFDLDSPKGARVRKTPTRRSLNSEMK